MSSAASLHARHSLTTPSVAKPAESLHGWAISEELRGKYSRLVLQMLSYMFFSCLCRTKKFRDLSTICDRTRTRVAFDSFYVLQSPAGNTSEDVAAL